MTQYAINYDIIKGDANLKTNPVWVNMFRMKKDKKGRYTDYLHFPKNFLFNVCNEKDYKQRKFRMRIVQDADGEKHIIISNGLPKSQTQPVQTQR
ncbi:MAG: hypothetical protein KKE71_06685 [Nanoarchaeota archaeon]|nr:hypothetical protein [Nanoarchaeota archaeon]MBU4300964.1 hypothetical protein [Nanoarchaeota archaeon]